MIGFDDFVDLYKTSFSLIFIFFSAFLFLLIDNDPPVFPLHPSVFTPDCYQISPLLMLANGSRINVTVHIGELTEFPPSAAIRLLRVIISSGDTISEYNYRNFWDISVSQQNISFCILHPVGGKIRAKLSCQRRMLTEIQHQINEIEAYPVGCSRAVMLPHLVTQLNDFCYSNNTIHYFVQTPTILMPMNVATKDRIPFTIHFTTAGYFQSDKPNHEIIYKPTLFVSATPKEIWRQLSDVLMPMWGSLFSVFKKQEFRVYLTRDQKWMIPNIQQMVPGVVMSNDTNVCIAEGHFIRSPGSIPFSVNSSKVNMSEIMAFSHHMAWIMDIKPDLMQNFKAIFTSKPMKPGCIVLDHFAMGMKNVIKRAFPKNEIVELPENQNLISEIADTVSSAQIFVGSHISSLIFGIFLHRGASMIEIQPDRCECTQFGKTFALMAGARYLPLRTAENCNRNNLLKYLNNSKLEYKGIDVDDVKKALGKLL